jgi:hypothetical protein
LFGAAILITPLLVVNIRFKDSPVRLQVHVWSLWLTIAWSAACATALVVYAIPHIVLFIIRLFGKSVERLRFRVEVRTPTSGYGLCKRNVTSLVDHGRQCMDQSGPRRDMGLGCLVRHSCHLSPSSTILGYHQPCHASEHLSAIDSFPTM